MKAITLRNLPEPLARRIEERASQSGASLDQTVIEMLTETESKTERRRKLDAFLGTWTAEEADAFDAELAIMRRIDPEMWSECGS